jgi:hypothetical protein
MYEKKCFRCWESNSEYQKVCLSLVKYDKVLIVINIEKVGEKNRKSDKVWLIVKEIKGVC